MDNKLRERIEKLELHFIELTERMNHAELLLDECQANCKKKKVVTSSVPQKGYRRPGKI